ncbi:hypothetical protein D9M71_256240 [compost metagenome]
MHNCRSELAREQYVGWITLHRSTTAAQAAPEWWMEERHPPYVSLTPCVPRAGATRHRCATPGYQSPFSNTCELRW